MASPNGFTNDGDVPKEQAGSADGVLGDADSDVPYVSVILFIAILFIISFLTLHF